MIRLQQRLLEKTSRTAALVRCLSAVAVKRPRPRRYSEPTFAAATLIDFNKRFFSPSAVKQVRIVYVEADGTERVADAKVGENLMDVAHENNIELEGACGGELACSTCHLIFDQETFDTLPPMTEEEQDMLDLAFEVTETSRLGCQVRATDAFEGITVRIPDDGFS